MDIPELLDKRLPVRLQERVNSDHVVVNCHRVSMSLARRSPDDHRGRRTWSVLLAASHKSATITIAVTATGDLFPYAHGINSSEFDVLFLIGLALIGTYSDSTPFTV